MTTNPIQLELPGVEPPPEITFTKGAPPMCGFWLTRMEVIGKDPVIARRWWHGGAGKPSVLGHWSPAIPDDPDVAPSLVHALASKRTSVEDYWFSWAGLPAPAPSYPYPLDMKVCPATLPWDWFCGNEPQNAPEQPRQRVRVQVEAPAQDPAPSGRQRVRVEP